MCQFMGQDEGKFIFIFGISENTRCDDDILAISIGVNL